MRMRTNTIAIVTVLLASPALAAAPPRVETLAWLEGVWTGTSKHGLAMEEHWTSALGGGMVGMHKDVRDGRMVAFEFLRITGDSSGVCYVASPGGAQPTRFCAIALDDTSVTFENLDHDFPQRIRYRVDRERRLHARIEGEVRGAIKAQEWTWTRRPCGP